jgi:hypothetical protein
MKLPGIKSQQGKDTKTLETIELFRGIVICYSLQFNRIMWSGQDPYQRSLMGPGGNNPMSGYDVMLVPRGQGEVVRATAQYDSTTIELFFAVKYNFDHERKHLENGNFFPVYAVKLLQCNLYLKSFCSKLSQHLHGSCQR